MSDDATSTTPACPVCTMDDVLPHDEHWECVTCGHEWPREVAAAAKVWRDAHGTELQDGDDVILIKDLKLRGSSQVLKGGSKGKNIRLVDADHDIDCKVDGVAMALKSCFVKKA
ncbi:zinc ribbon domain-containing protein YjdM [Actomonas aquatica]|uniref:Zinc ribbon domain-containing protein YjdM n=1 Tax=Actomonas aquatica TaxID=2866162 RepID=A0ABZ1C2T9_9BACT|nr:zinc ribbon domain-containing protein YjdM [Opitutus sp. WL0086]WRQ86021.1 zinc ribbon domain-containing protein YjdM [Opitutus sp. WL0086]